MVITPLMVTISADRLAHLETRILAVEEALADYASLYGMTVKARRLMVDPEA